MGLLISRRGQRRLTESAQSERSERDQHKVNGKRACLLLKVEISSGQVDEVLIYKGDDEARRTRGHQV